MTPYKGSLWDNHGRWWWKVTLPGEIKRKAIPLRDSYTGRVTTSRKTAEAIAQRLWDEAESKYGPASQVAQAATVGRLRTLWIVQQTRPDDAEMNTAALAMLANRPADSIRPSEVLELQAKMRASKLAIRTINRRVRAIASVFAFGAARDIVPAEVAWGIKSIAPIRGASRGFGLPDLVAVHKTLAECTPTLWRMVVLQMLTGLRSGELCRITAGDVTRDGDDWLLRIPRHKTDKVVTGAKILVLGPRAMDVIGPLLETKLPTEPLFTPEDSERERKSIRPKTFPSKRAKVEREYRPAYDARSYYQALMHAIDAAGVAHWHPHQLRHLAATAIADTLTDDHARAQLGHTSAGMTRRYIHERRQKAREVARELG
jgi:integrase